MSIKKIIYLFISFALLILIVVLECNKTFLSFAHASIVSEGMISDISIKYIQYKEKDKIYLLHYGSKTGDSEHPLLILGVDDLLGTAIELGLEGNHTKKMRVIQLADAIYGDTIDSFLMDWKGRIVSLENAVECDDNDVISFWRSKGLTIPEKPIPKIECKPIIRQ
jgi:hypothetical protein